VVVCGKKEGVDAFVKCHMHLDVGPCVCKTVNRSGLSSFRSFTITLVSPCCTYSKLAWLARVLP
jgi:hypothetical protein